MKIFEMFDESDKYYIVTEMLEGGELFERIISEDYFYEDFAAKIMK